MARYDDDAPSGSALPWFLFGLGLGAAMGLLFAPQSGAETRRAIGKKVRKLKHLAEDKLEDVMDTGGKKVRKLRENLSEVAEAFHDEDEGEEELEPRPSRAREELERRLAAARARRRGAPAPVGHGADDEEPGA
ncbi:MAG TPA: YtxH domain-containing protein [Gemmatimonadales bacterium]|nr:YtxH domain-containing protein [Gemmatimonadales bacterium]